ncbi:MAG: class I SAM-dependent methyltransferase [Sphingobacteriales bacterium]|nr:class I SAM-dependent methyltransferase [Sphingobacteriales bacterium]
MKELVHYTHCPVCGAAAISEVLRAKDYTVSGETFSVFECGACTTRFTQDAPGAAAIAPYYKSENYISHTNTSKGLVNTLYQWVRKRTLKQKRKLIQRQTGLAAGRLLDLGSGTGAFAGEMKVNGWNVTGLEPDADARQVAKDSFGVELQDTGRFYELGNNQFDAITMWHVLEHVHDLQGYLAKLKTLLKEKGRLVIAVPNYTSGDAAAYGACWAAYDVPRHLYHFSPAAMKSLVEKHGLRLLEYKPMWYDSFYVSLLSSKYKNGRTRLAAAFFRGLLSNLAALRDTKKCSSVIYIIGK